MKNEKDQKETVNGVFEIGEGLVKDLNANINGIIKKHKERKARALKVEMAVKLGILAAASVYWVVKNTR